MYKKILKEICKELDIKLTLLSDNWLMVLEKDAKRRYIVGYKFDLNCAGTSYLLDDKYLLYAVLNKNKIKTVKHHLINGQSFYKDKEKVLKKINYYFNKYNKSIVLKVNNGTCGNNVLHIKELSNIEEVLLDLFKKDYTISLCPFYEIKNEYRVIYLNGEVLLTYVKIKPIVIGDGKHSLKELLEKFNKRYFKKVKVADKILKAGEIYEYGWQFNLSKGALPSLVINEKTKEKVNTMALEIGKIVNLRFGSIDIIELYNGKLLCLEANSGVMMKNLILEINNGYDIAKDVYQKAVNEMFK